MREMLKFKEFIVEQKEGSGLTIFDIDDTLFKTVKFMLRKMVKLLLSYHLLSSTVIS